MFLINKLPFILMIHSSFEALFAHFIPLSNDYTLHLYIPQREANKHPVDHTPCHIGMEVDATVCVFNF